LLCAKQIIRTENALHDAEYICGYNLFAIFSEAVHFICMKSALEHPALVHEFAFHKKSF